MRQGKQETIGSKHIGKALKSNFIYLFEPFIIDMRKLFIPLILCLLLTFTLADFTDDLVSYYKLDETSGTTLIDSSIIIIMCCYLNGNTIPMY